MLTTREKWTKIIRGRILFCIQNFFINTTFLELYIIGSYIHITDGLFKPWSLHKLFNSFQTILIFILFNIWIFLIKHTMINKIIISLKLCRKSFLFSCPWWIVIVVVHVQGQYLITLAFFVGSLLVLIIIIGMLNSKSDNVNLFKQQPTC